MAPQYSCMENPMDGGAWWAVVHGVTKSRTRLSDFTFTFHLHALEKEMATHSSILAWRIPGTGEPGGLPSMGLHRVGHDWSDLAADDSLEWGDAGEGLWYSHQMEHWIRSLLFIVVATSPYVAIWNVSCLRWVVGVKDTRTQYKEKKL